MIATRRKGAAAGFQMRLALQADIAEQQLAAAELAESAALDLSLWEPWYRPWY